MQPPCAFVDTMPWAFWYPRRNRDNRWRQRSLHVRAFRFAPIGFPQRAQARIRFLTIQSADLPLRAEIRLDYQAECCHQ